MKALITIMLCWASFGNSTAQTFLNLLPQSNRALKIKIRKEFIKCLINDRLMTKSEARSQINSLKQVPVFSFTISTQMAQYDSTKKITEYLLPNGMFPFSFIMFFKNKNLHSTLDCSAIVNYERCEICNYDDSNDEKNHHFKYEIEKFLSIVPIQKCSLLFTVQFSRNTIWFVESNKTSVYYTENRSIYDPDEFILKHCSIETIRSLALGNLHSFCN
jgi:hypothetical protein